MSLEAFRDKIQKYLRQAGYQQQNLADHLGFSAGILSRKLHQTDGKFVTDAEVRAIVKILSEWQAISTKEQAIELLELANLGPSSFTTKEWASSPLATLVVGTIPVDAIPPVPVPIQISTTNNLPSQLTSLIGRGQALQQVEAMLERSEIRLLTLTGPGGVGKTRLALQLASNLLKSFEHGVFFIELESIVEAKAVPFVIAQSLGIPESGSQSPLEILKEYLRSRQLLLVLDNFEHLPQAALLLKDLLIATTHLKIIVTSRAILYLYGEHEFIVHARQFKFKTKGVVAD
jgi:Cdc6-like AAA superfamily ATPase